MPETETEKGRTEPGPLERLAGRGDEMIRRMLDELDRAKLGEAKGRLEKVERSVLERLNIAMADEIVELRDRVAELEQRLAKVEELAAKQDAASQTL
jgi:predicted nuclease with TOPRIM domain